MEQIRRLLSVAVSQPLAIRRAQESASRRRHFTSRRPMEEAAAAAAHADLLHSEPQIAQPLVVSSHPLMPAHAATAGFDSASASAAGSVADASSSSPAPPPSAPSASSPQGSAVPVPRKPPPPLFDVILLVEVCSREQGAAATSSPASLLPRVCVRSIGADALCCLRGTSAQPHRARAAVQLRFVC